MTKGQARDSICSNRVHRPRWCSGLWAVVFHDSVAIRMQFIGLVFFPSGPSLALHPVCPLLWPRCCRANDNVQFRTKAIVQLKKWQRDSKWWAVKANGCGKICKRLGGSHWLDLASTNRMSFSSQQYHRRAFLGFVHTIAWLSHERGRIPATRAARRRAIRPPHWVYARRRRL